MLGDAIRRGELPPGSTIDEDELSARCRTSRTPVREAIQQLANDGIVQVIPNRGACVAILSFDEMLSALHLRSLIEPEIARLVATAAGADVIAPLHEATQLMREAVASGDQRRWTDADLRLHAMLVKACPNRILGDLAYRMRTRMQLGLASQMVDIRGFASRTEEQAAIVAAIAAREPLTAAAAVAEHLRNLRAGFAASLR